MNLNQLVGQIFAECNRSREVLGNIVKITEQVQEISMNAAVSASHTGNHIRIFTEIARQIHLTTQKILGYASCARSEIDQVSNQILKAVLNQSHLQKYQSAAADIQGERNSEILTATIGKLEADVMEKIQSVYFGLFRCQAFIKNLIQMQNRIFAILNSMKIESISLNDQEQIIIQSLTENLEESHISGMEGIEYLFTMISSIRHKIRTNLYSNKEPSNETRQAV